MDNRLLAIGVATVFILCVAAGAVIVMNDNGSDDSSSSNDSVLRSFSSSSATMEKSTPTETLKCVENEGKKGIAFDDSYKYNDVMVKTVR